MRLSFETTSSKWLIQHHGDSILRLGGVSGVLTWKPVSAELVQPKQLPDGLLEVCLSTNPAKPVPFLVEIATYPEERLIEQVVRNAMLVFLDRRELPDVVTLVLRPKGNLRIADRQAFVSLGGTTRLDISWRIVELWNVPAEQLLSSGDVGLVPWIPLTQFSESPEEILSECRHRIDSASTPTEHENLMVVSHILARLRYNQDTLFQFLGGKQAMIESPLIQEILAEHQQQTIEIILADRFGPLPADTKRAILTINDETELRRLTVAAAQCTDLADFRARFDTRALGPSR